METAARGHCPVCLLTQVELNREAFWGGEEKATRAKVALQLQLQQSPDSQSITVSSSGTGECVSSRASAILVPRMLRCRAISGSDEKRRPPRAYLLFYPELPERQCEGDQTDDAVAAGWHEDRLTVEKHH
jgi:hypothetical protein